MRKFLIALAACFVWASANAQIGQMSPQPGPGLPPSGSATGAGLPANFFWANTFGSCVWGTSAGNDAGPCINAAIAKAASVTGGYVLIPAVAANVATAIVNNNSNVNLLGMGYGINRDNASSSAFLGATRLIWTGAAGGTLFDVEPTTNLTLYNSGAKGIIFDCAQLANICAKFSNVSHSDIDIGVSEPRSIGAYFTTSAAITDAPGIQENDISVMSRQTNSTYAGTGILFDGNSNFNVSYNRIGALFAWYNKGDGIVFGSQDNNTVDSVRAYPQPGATGSPVIVAAPGYTMPNGLSTTSGANYVGGGLSFGHTGAPVTIQGYTVASVLTPGVGNTGTAAIAPVTISTNALASIFSQTLPFASTTGLAAGMDFSCGNPSSGVPNHSAIATVVSTSIGLINYTAGAVASGTSCTFTWGITSTGLVGTYTITATGPTTYNLVSPNSGSHNQTGISVSNGVLAFNDIVLPISGAAVAGDTFTIVVQKPQNGIYFWNVDSGNANPDPYFAPGSSGMSQDYTNGFQKVTSVGNAGLVISFGRTPCSGLLPSATGQASIVIGDCAGGGSTGAYSTTVGGVTNQATNFGSAEYGGQSNASGGIDSFIGGGASNNLTGSYSRAGGFNVTDRGKFGADCYGSGAFSVKGDAQTCVSTLRISTNAASAVRLTADQLTAGAANCINIPNNSAYTIIVTITAFDHTTVTKSATWPVWSGLLTRGANAAATAVTMNSTPTPLTNGTLTGQAVAVTADTTNGCINVSYTPPTTNTDTFNVVAKVETVEVQ